MGTVEVRNMCFICQLGNDSFHQILKSSYTLQKKFMIDFKVVFANSSLTNLVYKNIKPKRLD